MEEKFELTQADINAIKLRDCNYLNSKGAKLYAQNEYAKAVEYYHLAAAMGNDNAIANLGYCYLYGRDIEQNTSLALAYLQIAAGKENVDACYKLGDIYGSDKWGHKDKEMAIYYYRMAASYIIGCEWEGFNIAYETELQKYPSLCFALARELMPGGDMATNIKCAYQFLKHAEAGYRLEMTNGYHFYEKVYADVLELLENDIFSDIKEEYDEFFSDDEEDEVHY